jgi:hypothetical protein
LKSRFDEEVASFETRSMSAPQDEEIFECLFRVSRPAEIFLILRRSRSDRLEGRTIAYP